MTKFSHNIVMSKPKVKIGELKAKLSKYLAFARGGREVIVMDRDKPVAKILPFVDDEPQLIITPSLAGRESFKGLPKFTKKLKGFNAVDDLINDRNERDLLS